MKLPHSVRDFVVFAQDTIHHRVARLKVGVRELPEGLPVGGRFGSPVAHNGSVIDRRVLHAARLDELVAQNSVPEDRRQVVDVGDVIDRVP